MIDCGRCSRVAESVAALARHLAEDHLISPSRAQAEAMESAGTNGKPAVTTAVIPPTKEPAMPSKPKPCKYCLRFAPNKCKRHGGEPRSTSYKATGKRKAATAKVATNGHKPASLAAQLDAVIERKRAELDQLEAAKAVLAGIAL